MLEISHVTRTFGTLMALDDVSFAVPDGQFTGFVGGNGAGKTTTMRIIMGVLAPTSGEVRWKGHPITRDDRSTFGYMPEERGLYPKQPILAQLTYLGELHGMRRVDAPTRTDIGLVGWDERRQMVKVNPIAAWDDDDVDRFAFEEDVFLNPLREKGYPSIGCAPCTRPVAPGEDARAGRWAGKNKTECGLHT